MNTLSKESRRDGLAVALPKIGPLQASILDALAIKGQMSAREIMRELGSTDLNGIRSRTTELCNAGLVSVIGRKKDFEGGVSVSVYKFVNSGQIDLFGGLNER